MAFINNQTAVAVVCFLVLFQLLVTSQAQPSAEKRAYRGTGGWTMNSIGYNAGLDALHKIFGKRDGAEETGYMSSAIGEDNVKAIVDDFVSFLQLKESGLLGPSLLRCIRAELSETVDK